MISRNPMPWLLRSAAAVALAVVPLSSLQAADPPPFDLPGPGLRVTVTRGSTTLPIGEVPSLSAGDTLTIRADLPEDQRARFLLLSAFLTGATNPPPKDWITTAETWKSKDKDSVLSLKVPDGARQMVLFLVPNTGGASGAISDAVRDKPGEFVRATQDLNQASLDRSRLDAFMGAIRAQENTHPEFLRTIAPTLASSLSMKLNAECLAKVIELQAACLLDNRDSLVLADVHSSSMTETLVSAPTDLALQLSYTREGGLGYYSPYISVVRDLARVFGAFSSPQLDYLPTISVRRADTVSLMLNAAPSFGKPKSVLVAAMPGIGTDTRPQLRPAGDAAICGARPGVVLPVEGAPLIYSTAYAHDVQLRLTNAAGQTVELPVEARADRGGYVVKDGLPAENFKGNVTAQLHGFWGFERFDGPSFTLQFPTGDGWSAGREPPTLVVGRDNAVTLTGATPACVESVTIRHGNAAPQRLTWKSQGRDAIAAALPIDATRPGDVTLEVRQFGATAPSAIPLRAYNQASRLDRLTIHAGDRWAELAGQRLDQVASVDLGGTKLMPDGLSRDGDTDHLRVAATTDVRAGGTARVTLNDGRTLNVPVTLAAARPQATVLSKSVSPKGTATGLALTPMSDTLLPDSARLTFSMRAADGQRFSSRDAIEVATANHEAGVKLTAGPNLQLQSPEVAVATLDPTALGPSVFGSLEFRVLRGDEAGDWQALTTLARLPRIDAIDCAADGCVLRGQGLFLIDAISATPAFDQPVAVPQGYTAATLKGPVVTDGKLYLKLRDAPKEIVSVNAARGQ